jgi:hypothetical protein
MVINDEISKEVKGNKDILSLTVYRFNNYSVKIEDDLDENELVMKIAENIKSRYKFFKVARKDNTKADVFMIDGQFGNLNEITVMDPQDMLPTEMIQTQMTISSLLEEEGFAQKTEEEITKTVKVEEVK